MPEDKIPIPEFAAKIKAKYPAYKDMNDTLLTQKIIEKYPEYKDQVDLSGLSVTKEGALGGAGAAAIGAPMKQDVLTPETISKVKAYMGVEPKAAPTKEEIQAKVKEEKPITTPTIESEAQNKINNIDEEKGIVDPLKELYSQFSTVPTGHEKAVMLKAADILKNRIAPNGYDAKQMLTNTFFGATGKDNVTAGLLRDKADQYDKTVEQPLSQIKAPDLTGANDLFLKENILPQIQSAAVKAYAEKNPQFKKELETTGIDPNDTGLVNKLNSFKLGVAMQDYMNDPNVAAYLQHVNPNLIPAFNYAQKNILTDNKDYGINVVANKVSSEVEKTGFNEIEPIFNYYGQNHKEFADHIAREKLTPQELDVWNKYIKDNQEQYMDAPSLFEGIGTEGEKFGKGILKTFTEPFTPASEAIKQEWEDEAKNVSADPQGFMKFLRNTGNAIGLVSSIGATGNILGIANPQTAGAVATTLGFFGDLLQEGKVKYSDNPVKAWTSAIFNTGIYAALSYDIFPADKAKAAFESVKPEVSEVIENLVSGRITREAARAEMNTLGKKAIDFVSGTLTKNARISTELTVITAMNRMLDKAMGADKSFHPDDEELNTLESSFLSFLPIAALGKYGEMKRENSIAAESIYKAAANPKLFSRYIDYLGIKDPNLNTADMKQNLEFVRKLKTTLDADKMPVAKQKKYLFQALAEKAVNKEKEDAMNKAAGIDNEVLRKQALEKITSLDRNISQSKQTQEDILKEKPTVQSAVVEIGGKIYEGKNHAEAILKDKEEGQDISKVDRQAEGKFRLSDGSIIYRAEAKSRFGEDHAEQLIEQDETSKKANEDYAAETTGQVAPEDKITVGDMIDKVGTYKGERGHFYQDGQTVVFKVEGKPKEYELGNVDELRNTPISDFDIQHEQSVITTDDEGNILVRGKKYVNNYSNPLAAINYDKDGNVISVTLDTPEGQKRTFRGNIGEDLAYQIHLKEISKDNETKQQFEQFINEDAEAKQTMDNAGLPEVAETKTTPTDEEVQREKIEPTIKEQAPVSIGKKEIAEQKPSTVLSRGDETAQKLQEDKDTLLVDGIKNVSKNKQASDLLKIAMNRGVIPERLYNDFGKELAAIKITAKSKTAVEKVAEVISKYVDAKNEKTDGFIKEQNQAIENADFKKRAYADMTDQEKFEAVIEDKAQTSEKLTPEELNHVNENYFKPEGYKYNENWGLVKEKKSKSLSPNIVTPSTEVPKEQEVEEAKRVEQQKEIDELQGSYDRLLASGTSIDDPEMVNLKNRIESLKSEIPPPAPPPPKVEAAQEPTPEQQWTGIRQEKLAEIDGAKEILNKSGTVRWDETNKNAMENLQARFPDKPLYDAARERVQELVTLANNKIPYSATSEDVAVMQYFNLETQKRISEIQGWDSPDEIQRLMAVEQWKKLNEDLLMLPTASKGAISEAARALYKVQEERRLDPDYGLQIRRMELLNAKGGEKLTEDDLKWTADQWEKEKELLIQEHEAREKGMQDSFDQKIADLTKEYEDKLSQAKKGKQPRTIQEKRENLLSQKGKGFADKLRKGKLRGGTYATIPGFPQAVNLVIEAIAQIVEKGATLADAIKQYIKEHKIEDEAKFTNNFFDVLDIREKGGAAYEAIQKMSDEGKVTGITNDMVAKNHIRDYVQSFIGETEPSKILDAATEDLKKVLPDVTKEQLREAFLKEGSFRQPTKEKIESDIKQDTARLTRIEKIEKDLTDLKEQQKIFSRNKNKNAQRKVDKQIEDAEKRLKDEMIEQGLKYSHADKFQKASLDSRAASHNQRIDDVSKRLQSQIDRTDITDEQRNRLNKLKSQLGGSKILLDPESRIDQSPLFDRALNQVKSAKSEFERGMSIGDRRSAKEVNNALQGIIDKFNTDKSESEQNIKLQRQKDTIKTQNAERQRKLNAGEYVDEEPKPLKKTDAELVKIKIQRDKLESERRKREDQEIQKNKDLLHRSSETFRGLYVMALIMRFGTALKVGVTSLLRPVFEATSKLTAGQAFRALFPTFYKAAKGGGETSSLKSIQKSFQAYFRSIGADKMNKIYEKANQEYEQAAKDYNDYKNEISGLGKDSPEYNKAQSKLTDLKNNMDKKLLNSMGNIMYQFIGSSSVKDMLEALLHRSNYIEQQFGNLEKESIKDGGTPEKLNYLFGFIGRSHSAMKTFSARANFAAGFIARMEAAIHDEGGSALTPDRILEIANDSYLDWERGKYTQKNFVSNSWNYITRKMEEFDEGGEWHKYSKAVSEGLRFDVPITRVPVNILHEAVMEYTVGAFRSMWKAAQEYRKAKKQVLMNEALVSTDKEMRAAIKEQLSKMDKDQAALIARSFRKGGFGLGVFTFTMLSGLVNFGGFHHRGEKRKKESELADDELNPGQVMFGKNKVGEKVGNVIEHLPGFYPAFFGLNAARVYNQNIQNGGTTVGAAIAAAMANLEAIQDAIPMAELINPIQVAKGVVTSSLSQIDKTWEANDVDENGDLIKRRAFDFKDQINLMIGNRKKVLTEENYKAAQQLRSDYGKAIEQAHKDGQSEEYIDQLKKERDDAIQQLYKDQNQ